MARPLRWAFALSAWAPLLSRSTPVDTLCLAGETGASLLQREAGAMRRGKPELPSYPAHWAVQPVRLGVDEPVTLELVRNSSSQLADIVYLNEGSRDDRRRCVEKQLGKAPFRVYRMEAVTPETLQAHCASINWQRTSESVVPFGSRSMAAILCSNYALWQHYATMIDGPEFLISFEDDVIITDQARLWREVQNLLTGPCQDYDYISVDTYNLFGLMSGISGQGRRVCSGRSPFEPGPPLFNLEGLGAAMQILRRSKLPAILDFVREKPQPNDSMFWQDPSHQPSFPVRAWMPGLVTQYAKMSTTDAQRSASGCEPSVGDSVHTGEWARDLAREWAENRSANGSANGSNISANASPARATRSSDPPPGGAASERALHP